MLRLKPAFDSWSGRMSVSGRCSSVVSEPSSRSPQSRPRAGRRVLGTRFPQNSRGKQQTRYHWLGTLRLRGGVAIDRLLVYGTGGLAYGAPKNRIDVSIGPFLPSHTGSNDDVRAGWTLGTGAEYAVTNNLTMKAEYLYYDLGRTTVTATATNDYPLADTTATGRFDNRGHIARVGINYKF
jgi:outer membrane immunogenic protein